MNSGGQSEEHCRGEKMRGDTRGEIRKDKDIKSERIYEMRREESKEQWRQEMRRERGRVCALWFIPVLLIWQLHGS